MRRPRSSVRPRPASAGTWLTGALVAGLAWIGSPAAAQQAKVSALTNATFGTVSLTSDSSSADDVCAYSSTNNHNYTVLATGDGSGGAFLLSAGAGTLAYEVEWAGTAGQTSGTALIAGTASGIFNSVNASSNCLSSHNASLIIRLRAAKTSVAQAGNYSGTLSITITPQ